MLKSILRLAWAGFVNSTKPSRDLSPVVIAGIVKDNAPKDDTGCGFRKITPDIPKLLFSAKERVVALHSQVLAPQLLHQLPNMPLLPRTAPTP